ncbi:LysM peptidoglycan-binding domain-containing protein [Enterococcus hirae]
MENIARKERRRLNETKRFRKVKRSAALVGTAMVGCSVAAPLIQPVQVDADQTPTQFGARINTAAFIAEIATYAQPIAQANDLYASVMIAQAVVESGWGSSALSQAPYYNLFGIKGSYQGQTVYMDTLEYLNNKWVSKKEPFRQYPSFAESFNDNAYVLRNTSFGNGYYYAGTWKSNTKSYTDATACLTGRYATDPGYAGKLNNIITTYGLTKYDTPASGNAGGGATIGNGGNTGNTSNSGSTSGNSGGSATTTGTTYTVKSGDSVWGISHSFGITMAQLIEWNNIKNNFIYPGQKLTIKGGQSAGSSTTNTGNNASSGNTSGNTNTSGSTGQATGAKYTVKSGDSVWKIANDHGISMNQLIEWNNIKNNFVYPGQQLVVSKGSSSASGSTSNTSTGNTSSNTANTGSTTSGSTYTVKAGESVWSVSNKFGISMNQLIQWNNIKNNFIYPGQKLIVKGGSSKASATATTKPTASTPASTTPTASSTGDTKYTVKAGESVWGVANKHHITMDQLIEWNNIKNNFIYPGQEVIVKKGTAQSTPAKSDEKTYTVKAGESVWGVADSHGITMNQLIEWNNIKNNFIYPGQQLIVKK